MNGEPLDPRLNAFRADLAAAELEGVVDAARFIDGSPACIVEPVAPLRQHPRFDARLDTEALCGERLTVFDDHEGWSWVQLERDRYVGYVPSEALGPVSRQPTHRVVVPRTHSFPAPDKKTPPSRLLPLNALLTVAEPDCGEAGFLRLENGEFVFERHIAPVCEAMPDFVAVAEQFIGTPYLWGGRTSLGIDCSGLAQVSLEAAGRSAPRDSDMQEKVLGERVGGPEDMGDLRRGDLVFWDGHMGIMIDAETLLHANAFYMQTIVEPLDGAVARIADIHGAVTSVRRLD